MEKTIAKLKYENTTYKLLKITTEEEINLFDPWRTTKYMILKNRKRLCTTKWINKAKQKFANIITEELIQTKIQF